MKRFLLSLLFLAPVLLSAVEKISFADVQNRGWDAYVGKTVRFTSPLVVVGNYYDSLLLAPERLFCAEERALGLAEGDSTMFRQLKEANQQKLICLQCHVTNYQLRTGVVIRNLQAKVTAPARLLTGAQIRFEGNKPERRPSIGKCDLLVCGANIENYFYDLGGYASRKTTREQQRLQREKVAKGLLAVDADIYGICEMQRGSRAPADLVSELNRRSKSGRYAFVDQECPDGDTVGCCFIYRADKVRPYGRSLRAYHDPANPYAYRMLAQGFEDLASGERFVLSVNHLKSKRSDGSETNTRRMNNVDSILVMLDEAKVAFGDEDILLVGDYNCYSQEQPVRKLVDSGYADLLSEYAADNYSYVFRAEVGFLDRCFATPSMAGQVINVQPYHLNADYYYSRGFKRGLDNTKFRYSDHDPLLIGIRFKK